MTCLDEFSCRGNDWLKRTLDSVGQNSPPLTNFIEAINESPICTVYPLLNFFSFEIPSLISVEPIPELLLAPSTNPCNLQLSTELPPANHQNLDPSTREPQLQTPNITTAQEPHKTTGQNASPPNSSALPSLPTPKTPLPRPHPVTPPPSSTNPPKLTPLQNILQPPPPPANAHLSHPTNDLPLPLPNIISHSYGYGNRRRRSRPPIHHLEPSRVRRTANPLRSATDHVWTYEVDSKEETWFSEQGEDEEWDEDFAEEEGEGEEEVELLDHPVWCTVHPLWPAIDCVGTYEKEETWVFLG